MALVAAWCPGRARTLGRAANTRNNVIWVGRPALMACHAAGYPIPCVTEGADVESGPRRNQVWGPPTPRRHQPPSALVDLVASCPSKAVKRCSRPVLSIEEEVRWNGHGVVGGRAAHRPSGSHVFEVTQSQRNLANWSAANGPLDGLQEAGRRSGLGVRYRNAAPTDSSTSVRRWGLTTARSGISDGQTVDPRSRRDDKCETRTNHGGDLATSANPSLPGPATV